MAQTTVTSSTIDATSVTIYRDPQRGQGQMNLGYLQGFALISEQRTITLAQGASTIRFEGVAEGMIAVSAIITGLPGGVVQKNRDKAILSPASLVDGTLGNRVTLNRTNPATGAVTQTDAIVRSVAYQGLVLETTGGFEALRCSGLPEGLVFGRVPPGLSATPVLSVDTVTTAPVTAQITLTYLASGFDWSANYIAHFDDSGRRLDLAGWLTLANSNGQSFADAELLVIAGELNIEQPYRQLADPPDAPPLQLECYPLGSTADGSPVEYPYPPPPPPPPPPMMMSPAFAGEVIVTASRRTEAMADSVQAVTATQEELGDLKLYRVPFRTTVAANAQKQVAFAFKVDVKRQMVYRGEIYPGNSSSPEPMQIELRMTNKEKDGLGLALPSGGFAVFESANGADLLLGESQIRDYPVGGEVKTIIGESAQVQLSATSMPGDAKWRKHSAKISNANPFAVEAEVELGNLTDFQMRGKGGKIIRKNGQWVWAVRVPGNSDAELRYEVGEVVR